MNTRRVLRGIPPIVFLVLALALGGSASARSELAFPAAEHWDGTSWTSVAVPSNGASLNAVVAPAANDVWAFGVSSVGEHWNGTTWRGVKLAIPKDSAAAEFYGAAAVSADDVWAVGDVSPRHAPSHGIIEHWNGRRWQLVPGPPTRSELSGVTALSADDAWAVGQASVSTPKGFEQLALTLHWNGKTWKQVPTPDPAAPATPALSVDNSLASVAGSSPRNVWAVGQYYLRTNDIRGSRALVLHWNGSRWTRVPNPALVSANVSLLNGVSALSATGVWAVGSTNRHGAQHALVESWNGKRWKAVRVPGPRLAGVSALGADDAWAAGGPDGSGEVMHWNGSAWTLATKVDKKHGLAAVAEISPTDVWAVGGRYQYSR
jgi:hypothetical protein